jgi:hypothetical protein
VSAERLTVGQMAILIDRAPPDGQVARNFAALLGGFAVHNGPDDAVQMALKAMIYLIEVEDDWRANLAESPTP